MDRLFNFGVVVFHKEEKSVEAYMFGQNLQYEQVFYGQATSMEQAIDTSRIMFGEYGYRATDVVAFTTNKHSDTVQFKVEVDMSA